MAEHSPRPWKLDGRTIRDADGDVVISMTYPASMEARRLIVDAVNAVDATLKLQRTLLGWSMERDRLRNIVRRLADALDTFTLEDHEIDLIREAREAIGEGEA